MLLLIVSYLVSLEKHKNCEQKESFKASSDNLALADFTSTEVSVATVVALPSQSGCCCCLALLVSEVSSLLSLDISLCLLRSVGVSTVHEYNKPSICLMISVGLSR